MRWKKSKKKKKEYVTRGVNEPRLGDSREITKFALLPTHISKYNMIFWEKYIVVEKYTVNHLSDDTIGVFFRRLFTKNKSNAFYSWVEVGKKYIN